ncbi:ABC transporter permease subunit [Sphingomonas sp.]|uniref:ABC transporter permease subunit n=1 Tax=Sphingomonas sp. TaxID=28214 RepID=UPI0035C7ECCE
MRRRGLLAGALALLLAACGGGGDSSKAITIGVQKGGVLFVAKERGEVSTRLEAQGITPVRWVEFPSGPPLIEAMRAGAVDLGAVGDTPVAYAQASGSDILFVATHSFPSSITGGLIVPKGSTIRTAADLKSKRLAFTKGSASELGAVVALKKYGLTLKDVTPVYLAPGDAMTAFANGSIDAWLTWDPYRALAQERFGAREVDIDRAGLYGMGRWTLFRRVILPGALPSILVGLRFALGIMWLTLIVAETIAANSGIGYMANQAREFSQTDVIVLAILVYAALGKLADTITRLAERRFLRWNPAYGAR